MTKQGEESEHRERGHSKPMAAGVSLGSATTERGTAGRINYDALLLRAGRGLIVREFFVGPSRDPVSDKAGTFAALPGAGPVDK